MSAYIRMLDDKLPRRIQGIYLTGSVALDDYRPGVSHIDFVAVSETALEPSELKLLRQVQTEHSRKLSVPKLDGVYLTWSALAATPLGLSAPYYLLGHFEPKGDFAITPVTWWTLHRHPLPLRGPTKPVVYHD